MGRLAILCPGQGSQHPAMFNLIRSLAQPPAAPDLAALENLLGRPLDALLADLHALYANRSAQPLVVAATLAVWEALRPALPPVDVVAGYSVGELSAYAVAGSLGADEAVALASRRAACMDAASAGSEAQGLLALSGLTPTDAGDALSAHGLHLAIENGADAFIVGGGASGLTAFAGWAAAAGAHVTPLPVGVASHTPLMQTAAEAFSGDLQESALRDPALPVLAGVSGDRVTSRAGAITALTRQMTQTVRWADCMDALAEAGVSVALELGPGVTLTRMLRERHPQIEVRSICNFRSVRGTIDWVARHAG